MGVAYWITTRKVTQIWVFLPRSLAYSVTPVIALNMAHIGVTILVLYTLFCWPLVTHHTHSGLICLRCPISNFLLYHELFLTICILEHYAFWQCEGVLSKGGPGQLAVCHVARGVTPIHSIVMAGQDFDQLFSTFDRWPCWFSGLWPLTTLNFNCWPLTTCTFTEVYGRMHSDSTPSLVYKARCAVIAVTFES